MHVQPESTAAGAREEFKQIQARVGEKEQRKPLIQITFHQETVKCARCSETRGRDTSHTHAQRKTRKRDRNREAN